MVMASPLGYVYSRADALKRQLYDMITNPRDYASMLGGRIVEGGQEREALMNQAFGDPTNPLKITNEKALAALTDKIMQGEMGITPLGITAYHGSPYLFKQFDPMKVGTGEGAQAYGTGAGYTAESRKVAESYQEGVKDIQTIKAINQRLSDLSKVMDQDSAYPGAYRKFKSDVGRQAAQEYDDLMMKRSEVRQAPGYLYKGDIPDEILPKFLDWDKPLSQQTPEVQSALEKLGFKVDKKEVDDFTDALLSALEGTGSTKLPKDPVNPTGESIYRKLAERGDFDTASKKLDEIGIRGIRYFDATSRAKQEGTSNFIPFRPEDFKIQEINDTPISDWISKGLLAP